MKKPKIAVLLPCYNEEKTIEKVVRDFRAVLPDAIVYVYDNNSKDATVEMACKAGAIVRIETQQGKGHVVRRMFRDVEADFYVMADGDDTYEASIAPAMLALALERHDLVSCVRRETDSETLSSPSRRPPYRSGHRFGNMLLTGTVRRIFGDRVHDMLSGYKVFSRRFVKSFPALSQGFDIETELTIHALELAMPVAHVEGPYRGRSPNSESKLRTYRDGWRILMMIFKLVRHERPILFFGLWSMIFAIISLALIAPIVGYYLDTGLVPRFPTAILSMGLMIVAILSLMAGTMLDTITRGRRELRMLVYLQYPVFSSDEMAAMLNSKVCNGGNAGA